MVFRKILVQSAQKLYNRVYKYSLQGVVCTLRLFRCRLDDVFFKDSSRTTSRHLQHSFSKINSNAKKGLLYSFNWVDSVVRFESQAL